jgi:hypothetical protein
MLLMIFSKYEVNSALSSPKAFQQRGSSPRFLKLVRHFLNPGEVTQSDFMSVLKVHFNLFGG